MRPDPTQFASSGSRAQRPQRMRSTWRWAWAVWLALAFLPVSAAEKKPEGQAAPAPKFSLPGGVYTNRVSVRLAAGAGTIRYTVDGSEPTASSRTFSGPIRITGSTVVKAKTFDGEGKESATVSQNYVLIASDLVGFSSNLPLVILNTFEGSVSHEAKTPGSIRFIDVGAQGRSALTGPASFDGRARLNVRGYTSLRYPKRSFHVKTRDASDKPLHASILGFPAESDWVLYAPYPDKTLLRDVLAYELSNQMGRYASRTRFVEVFVNESGGLLSQRHYAGVYVFEEKVKRDRHRVDVHKLTREDKTEPNLSGGYIFKKDHTEPVNLDFPSNPGGFSMFRGGPSRGSGYLTGPGAFPANPEGFLPARVDEDQAPNLNFFPSGRDRSSNAREGFRSSQGNEFLYVEPTSDKITSAQKIWLRRYVNQCEAALYGPNFRDPRRGYAAYLDPDSFIDHHLLVELTKNIDGFRFSTFFHKDRGGRIQMGPIWDWNLSFGNANGKQGFRPQLWYWPQLDDQQYSWFRRLFQDPDFAQRYVDRYGELRTNVFALSNVLARVDRLSGQLEEAQARNFRRWPILGQSVWPNSYVGDTYEEEVAWMKQWIRTRLTWIGKQFLSPPAFSLPGGSVAPGTRLTLQSAAGEIHYTLDGSDPRAPGGAASSKAHVYSEAIVLRENAQVFARARLGERWSSPILVRYSLQTPPARRVP